MTERAQKIWDIYVNGYSEALMTPVECFDTYLDKDSKKILASIIREIANEHGYYWREDLADVGDMVVDARLLYELANELEALK
jgi:hypothetical protein